MYHNMFGGGMWFGWFFWLIIIVIVAWFIITMVNRSQKNSDFSSIEERPLDILINKYAKGEIDKEEYLEKKKDLSE